MSLGSHQPIKYEKRFGHGPAQKPTGLFIDSIKYGVTLVWSQESVSKTNNFTFSYILVMEFIIVKNAIYQNNYSTE